MARGLGGLSIRQDVESGGFAITGVVVVGPWEARRQTVRVVEGLEAFLSFMLEDSILIFMGGIEWIWKDLWGIDDGGSGWNWMDLGGIEFDGTG